MYAFDLADVCGDMIKRDIQCPLKMLFGKFRGRAHIDNGLRLDAIKCDIGSLQR